MYQLCTVHKYQLAIPSKWFTTPLGVAIPGWKRPI